MMANVIQKILFVKKGGSQGLPEGREGGEAEGRNEADEESRSRIVGQGQGRMVFISNSRRRVAVAG